MNLLFSFREAKKHFSLLLDGFKCKKIKDSTRFQIGEDHEETVIEGIKRKVYASKSKDTSVEVLKMKMELIQF